MPCSPSHWPHQSSNADPGVAGLVGMRIVVGMRNKVGGPYAESDLSEESRGVAVPEQMAVLNLQLARR